MQILPNKYHKYYPTNITNITQQISQILPNKYPKYLLIKQRPAKNPRKTAYTNSDEETSSQLEEKTPTRVESPEGLAWGGQMRGPLQSV